jgi:hypothetical protein
MPTPVARGTMIKASGGSPNGSFFRPIPARASQLSLRRSFGLVYRVVAPASVMAALWGWCPGAVSEIQLRRAERVGWVPRTQASTTSAKRSHNYRND